MANGQRGRALNDFFPPLLSRFSGDVSSYSLWSGKEEDEEEGKGGLRRISEAGGGGGGAVCGKRNKGGVAAEIHAAL